MKKIICLVLCLTLLLTVLIGCNDRSDQPGNPETPGSPLNPENPGGPVNPGRPENPEIPSGERLSVSGIDAAKLLLAEERLNEKLLKNEGDIFENGVQVMHSLAGKAIENLGVRLLKAEPDSMGAFTLCNATAGYTNTTPFGLSTGNAHVTTLGASVGSAWNITLLGSEDEEKTVIVDTEKKDIGNMEVVGDTVVWTDLGEVSNSYEYFLNLTNNIVLEAESCAKLIDFVKKNIRIVDKWVELGDTRYYLSVSENEELLCEESGSGDDRFLIICRRFRNEDGKDVYEMYRSYGTKNERRMTYIPGERYELSENRKQHFIATNTKGYWENYVLGDMGSHYNVSYLVMKDDICYSFGRVEDYYVSIDILSADRQTDLFLYTQVEESAMLTLKLNGFTNIEKISAPKENVSFGPGNSYAYVQLGEGAKLYVTRGTVIEENQSFCGGKVRVDGITVMSYSYGYAGEMILRIVGSHEEAMQLFKQFLTETGLGCSRDIDTVIEGTQKSLTDSKAVFNYYQWNGYTVNTEEGIRQAILVEEARYDEISAYYDGVKNAERVTFDGNNLEQMQLLMSFPPIVGNVSSGAKMEEGKLIIDSLTLTVNDVKLFVKDEPYHIVIALEDSAGGIIHLEQTVLDEVKYAEEKEFSVAMSSFEVTLPHLIPGNYRVVAYIATSEGIRSSKVAAVAFDAVDGQSVNLVDVDLVGTLDASGALMLAYTERVDVNVSIESQTALSYDDFKQLVCEQAFKYGIPDESQIELRQDEGYVALTGSESEIADGEYRIKYSVENGGYVRKGYVYVAYSVIPAQPEQGERPEQGEQPAQGEQPEQVDPTVQPEGSTTA